MGQRWVVITLLIRPAIAKRGGGGVFLLSVQHCGEYISTVFGYI